MYDIIIIGAGPAGLFVANELSSKNLNILIIDKKSYVGGSGAITDGKLNLSYEIGMDLEELKLDKEEALKKINYIDKIFVKYGADKKLYGVEEEKINFWKEKALKYGINLIASKQRHMGSDNTFKIIKKFQKDLENKGIKFLLKTKVGNIKINKNFEIYTSKENFESKYLIVAPGRSGAYWFREQAKKLNIKSMYGAIDVGVRVEVKSNIYKNITDIIYDPKFILRSHCHGDKVRTFCTNPNGRVKIEENSFKLINGDALKKYKTNNTNFAILTTLTLTKPIADTKEYGINLIKFALLAGGGKPIIQRYGDLKRGSRSKVETFFSKERGYDNLKPTLKLIKDVVPADISLAYPDRIVNNIKEMIELLDEFIPGIANPETLIYAPEVKFYDTKYETNKYLETNIKNLYVAGDGVGKSRGIVGAALNGILVAGGISKTL